MTLADTLAAVEAGDHLAALRAVLEAWRACKHPRMAALVEALGAEVAATRARPGGKTVADKQVQWLALAAIGDPGDVELLLATLTEIEKAKPLEERIAALANRIDPRIATALHAMLEHPPIPGATGRGALRAAVELVIAIADPRSLEAFERLRVRLDAHRGGGASQDLRRRLPDAIEQLRAMGATSMGATSMVSGAESTTVVLLAPDDAALLDAIDRARARATPVAKPTAGSADALFAAVYANPADDTARSVLADFLQERGELRGELIALQLARAAGGKRSKREAELLERCGREWLGALAPVINKSGMAYERGFLARCSVNPDGEGAARAVIGRPEWATVEDLDMRSWPRGLEAALTDAMPVLRALRGVSFAGRAPPHPRIETLEISILTPSDVSYLGALAVPALRTLVIHETVVELARVEALWRSPLASQLARLEIDADEYVTRWIPEVSATTIPHVAISDKKRNGWRLHFEAGVVTAEYIWSRKGPSPDAADLLATLLRAVMSPNSWRVEIDTKVDSKPLAKALARFASFAYVSS